MDSPREPSRPVLSELMLSCGGLVAAADPIPDTTAWDAEFSRRHWVTMPDRLEPGCSIGYNPYWAVRVHLVGVLHLA